MNDFDIVGAEDEFGLVGEDDTYGAIGMYDIVGQDDDMNDLLSAVSGDANGGSQVNEQFASKMRELRAIDPNAVAVMRKKLTQRRRWPLGFRPVVVAPGATVEVTSDPQQLFRPERLVVPSNIAFFFDVLNVRVGTESQLVSTDPVPAVCFTEVARGTSLDLNTASVGNTVTMTVRNIDAAEHEFRAGIIGTIAKR